MREQTKDAGKVSFTVATVEARYWHRHLELVYLGRGCPPRAVREDSGLSGEIVLRLHKGAWS